jgi:hypothetical protein
LYSTLGERPIRGSSRAGAPTSFEQRDSRENPLKGLAKHVLAPVLSWLMFLPMARSAEPEPDSPRSVTYLQSWLGAVETDDPWILPGDEAGGPYTRSVGTLPYVGGSGMVLRGERVRYGFEGGGLVSWKNYGSSFRGVSSGGLLVGISVDNALFSFETFLGGVVALEPAPGVRFTLAGGPALAWMRLDNDDDEVEVTPLGPPAGSNVFISLNGSENDFSFALYGRAGVEFDIGSGLLLGVSARYAEHDFDFGSSGMLEYDKVQWFLTLGAAVSQ